VAESLPTSRFCIVFLLLLLAGCNGREEKQPMTAQQMKAAIEECAKYDLKATFWRGYSFRIVEASCEPKDR